MSYVDELEKLNKYIIPKQVPKVALLITKEYQGRTLTEW